MTGPTVLLYGSRRPLDQFAGVPERLIEDGAQVLYERMWDHGMRTGLHAQPELIRRADVIGFADLTHKLYLRPTRIARTVGTPTVLVVDGVTEFSNIYLNPWMGRQYLRPAPQDLVLALGPLQERILGAMGNPVRSAGLPRLDGLRERLASVSGSVEPRSWVVVATAFTPALSQAARERLLEMLASLRAALDRRGLGVRWRLTGGLAERLDVPADTAPLAETLAGASAVITTASTLAVESMIAGVPTAVAHPHPWPLWVPAAWEWRPEPNELSDRDRVAEVMVESREVRAVADDAIRSALGGFDPRLSDPHALLDALLRPDAERLRVQAVLLDRMHTPDSASKVGRELLGLATASKERFTPATVPIEQIGHTVVRRTPKRRPRALSLLQCGGSPVHGVTNWSVRMSGAFAREERLGWEFHTLFVASSPTNFEVFNTPPIGDDPFLHRVVLDPMWGTHERIEAVLHAAEAIDADVVIPSHDEEVLAVAARLRARGVRCLGIAHVDEVSEFERIAEFGGWDGLVGVSRACVDGIGRAMPGATAHQIVYGVPLAARARRSDRTGPVRLGYLGRMVDGQKRIGDLIPLIVRLDQLGVDFEFHIVGDGPDMPAWLARAKAAGIVRDRLVVHGRRSMEWVESFLPSMDLSVIVSGWEGTSVSMLEAMAQGVVPCVTRVASGVEEWIEDGVHGIVVPIGTPEMMAERIAEVAADRDLLDRMGAAAHDRMVERGAGVSHAAERYARVFGEMLVSPRACNHPSDRAVRLRDRYEWSPSMPDDDGDADRWVRAALEDCGFGAIAVGAPQDGCDAVLISATAPRPDGAQVQRWRRAGLGVGVSPNLCVERCVLLAESAVRRLSEAGCQRIAVFGAGTQSAAFGPLIRRGGPIVGWIDDSAEDHDTHMGLPVCRAKEAVDRLRPDGVVLNSQRFEPLLAERCVALGLGRFTPVVRDDESLRACVVALRWARTRVERGGSVVVVCGPDTTAYASAVGVKGAVGPEELASLVGSASPPDAVLLALESDESAARSTLAPWAAAGVVVLTCLQIERLPGPVAGKVEQLGGEQVEAEAVLATSGDRR